MIGKAIHTLLEPLNLEVTPEVAEQEQALPYVVYQLTGSEKMGANRTVSYLERFNMVLIVVAKTYTAAVSHAENIQTTLDRYNGTVNEITIEDIFYTGKNYEYDGESDLHLAKLDFVVWEFVNPTGTPPQLIFTEEENSQYIPIL